MDSGTNNNNNNDNSSGSSSSSNSNSNRITAIAAAIAVAAAASLSQLQKRKREHDPLDHQQQAEPCLKAPRLGVENGEEAEESEEGNSEGSEEGSEEEDEDEDEDEEDDEEDDDPDGGDVDETAIKTQEKEETIHPYWRPVQFFHDMIKDPSGASPTYKTLDPMQKLIFALGIRNLYLATRRSSSAVRDGDRQILQGMQRLVDEDDAPIDVEGLQVSFYPSATYSELRHFEDLDRKIAKHKNVNYYAQVGQSPRMFAAFAKPAA